MRSASTARLTLREIAVEDDEQDGAGADEDRDVQRDVGAPVAIDAGHRLDDGNEPERRGQGGGSGERAFVVGKRDLQHAGAGAEGRERLCLADDCGKRQAFEVRARGAVAMTVPPPSVT